MLPLFLFLLATFIVPIGAMLGARRRRHARSRAILPRVTAELARWDGRDLPPDAAYAALIDDIRAAREAGTLASAATRLNYDVAGFRSLLFATGRRLAGEVDGLAARDRSVAIDPKWGERETWAAIRRAAGPVTDFYLLAALDLRRDASEAITGAPPEQAVFRNVLGRTLWISGVVTLVCLLLGYPVAYFIARQPPRARRDAAVPRAAAVLDVAAGAHRRLGRAAAARGHPQQPAAVARARHRAGADDLQPLRRLRGDGARAAAVHGAAAVRGDEGHLAVVPARRVVARRARRSPRSGASTCRRRCPASAPAA